MSDQQNDSNDSEVTLLNDSEVSEVTVTMPVRAIIPVKFRRADDHLILVASHAYWKERICNAITNKETLDVKEIFRDDSCDVGYWLHHSEVHPHVAHLQSYHDLMKRNAEFHVQASKVAEYINAKKYDAALRLTECTSAFESASNAVISAIFTLKRDFDHFNKRTSAGH
ncbi:MAG: hypothetical protein PHN45_09610 [Methylococcales bacterium]|nr:hypothetical protein [Methylococcales bacterium]MDD5754993.1 hypothetical protein [Methylococcales bacterium]